MSLKAKIEAVIYAAEEPVTLAQLAVLFQTEALEERRGRVAKETMDAAVSMSMTMSPESGMGWEMPLVIAGEMAAEAGAAEAPAAEEKDPKQEARQRDREARDEIRRIANELIADYAEEEWALEVRE